jgi:hypothetical protein
MKPIRKILVAAGFALFATGPAVVLAEEPTLTEFQDLVYQYSVFLGAETVTDQLETFDYDQWQQLYEVTPSKGAYAESIINVLTAFTDTATGEFITPHAISPSIVVTGEFEPRYPDVDMSSPECGATILVDCYGEYIDGANAVGFFSPGGDETGFQDDRCDEHQEGVAKGGHVVQHGLAIAAQAICDAAPLETNVAACPGAGIVWGLDYAIEELIVACEAHTGNVDGAEIEAAYENTRTILDKTNDILDLAGTIETDEVNFTDDDELTAHEDAIKQELIALDNAMRRRIIALDNATQEELNVLKDMLESQQRQLNRIIRLLD